MELKPVYLSHLGSFNDLVTTHDQTRSGFLALVLEKNLRANPYIEQARNIQEKAKAASAPEDLLKIDGLHDELLTAAGISAKAAGHLAYDVKESIISELVEKVLSPAGDKFVEELIFRYLLIKGDALGGSIRNFIGASAQWKLIEALVSALRLASVTSVQVKYANKWMPLNIETHWPAGNITGLSWNVNSADRILFFNKQVPIVNKSVDLLLLSAGTNEEEKTVIGDCNKYISLGELKGGFDPAGADEHWKTAHSALHRIRESFSKLHCSPALFFIGAAIEKSMAAELWQDLESGLLANAANLNNDAQVSSVCSWLQGL
jgi:hypothetical protein